MRSAGPALRVVGLCFLVTNVHCRSKSSADDTRPAASNPSALTSIAAAGSDRSCGAKSEPGCGSDRYCHDESGLCGQGPNHGACRARPERCPSGDDPVCACDHKPYKNECLARQAGADISVHGGCGEGVPGRIACGARFCDARSSYCEIVLSDVRELPSTSSCRPLPKSCSKPGGEAPGCDCFPAGTRCSSFCGAVETAGATSFRLTCVGGY